MTSWSTDDAVSGHWEGFRETEVLDQAGCEDGGGRDQDQSVSGEVVDTVSGQAPSVIVEMVCFDTSAP